jgi:8-oxo-dGTP diphosphatase
MNVDDLQKGIRAVIRQYTDVKGMTLNQDFAVAKIREEMAELSEALSDIHQHDDNEAVVDEIADVVVMAFVLSDMIDLDPVEATQRKWLSKVEKVVVNDDHNNGVNETGKNISQNIDVGVGVVIPRVDGKILVGKRIGNHAPYYTIPGGKMFVGETFEQAAIREVEEETGLHIQSLSVIGITNNLFSYKHEGYHTISIILHSETFTGNLELRDPHLCSGWHWIDPNEIPEPHFEASQKGIRCYLDGDFYES